MGEKKEKGARPADTDKSPRKSARLDPQVAARGDAAAPVGSDSHSMDDAFSSSTSSGGCQHFRADGEETELLIVKIESLKCGPAPPECDHCLIESFGSSVGLIMVCAQCVGCFCTGLETMEDKPLGHIGRHARENRHWVGLWLDKPTSGYCFFCEHGVVIASSDTESEGLSSFDDDTMSSEVRPAVGHARASGSGMQPAAAGGHARASGADTDVHGYVVRGIPNVGNTCYMNAMVQCLLVLEKLRVWMLGPDTPMEPVGMALRELFEDTRAGNDAGGILNPWKLLRIVRILNPEYEGSKMHDSHEVLCYLRDGLNAELKKPPYMREGVPTVVDSIFHGQLSSTLTTKCCQSDSVSQLPFYELQLPLPEMDPPKSVASPQPQWHRGSHQKSIAVKQLLPEILERDSEKVQTVVDGGGSRVPGTELQPVPLEVDYSETEQVPQKIIDVLPLKSVAFLPEGVPSINVGELHNTMADSHPSEDAGLPSLVSPVMEKNASMASGSDVDRQDIADVGDLLNEPEVSTDNKESTYEVKITSEDKGKALVSDIVYDEKLEDSNSLTSIKDCLSLYFKGEVVEKRCENCSRVPEQLSTTRSADSGPKVRSPDEKTSVHTEQADLLDRKADQNDKPSDVNSSVECISSTSQPHDSDVKLQIEQTVGRTTEAIGPSFPEKDSSSCSTENKESDCSGKVEEKIDLLSAQGSQKANTPDQNSTKQRELNSAHKVGDIQNEQKDRSGHADKTVLISKLPPVLTIQLVRFQRVNGKTIKRTGHVSFEENLDVGQFVDPRSEDKDNARYGLVGVVEHIGSGTNAGHYIAYVRGSRTGSHQQLSSGSSWFCANDDNVREVSLEKILKCEAFVLFYERIECQGTSGNRSN